MSDPSIEQRGFLQGMRDALLRVVELRLGALPHDVVVAIEEATEARLRVVAADLAHGIVVEDIFGLDDLGPGFDSFPPTREEAGRLGERVQEALLRLLPHAQLGPSAPEVVEFGPSYVLFELLWRDGSGRTPGNIRRLRAWAGRKSQWVHHDLWGLAW